MVCRKLFCPEWGTQQWPITPSLSKVSVLFTVWTVWLKIPALVCASKRLWLQWSLNTMQTSPSLFGAPRRLLGEEDTPCLRKGATRSEGGGVAAHPCPPAGVPGSCCHAWNMWQLCASPHKGTACPAAVTSLFYERKLSQLMVLTNVGHCCFSYPLGVSLENSLKQKHKMGFVEMCELTWSLQNLCVYFWKQNNPALQLAVFGSTAQFHGCSRPCETGRWK